MSVRTLLPAAVLLFLATVWYLPMAPREPAPELPKTIVVHDQAETETTAARYSHLKEHVRQMIDSIDEATEGWYDRNAAHVGKSRAGKDVRRKVQIAMRQEDQMVTRWKTTLQKMTDGEYTYEQAVIESRKIDAESDAFMAELRSIVRDMQQIQGCHCGG